MKQIEPSVNDQLKFARLVKDLDKMDLAQMKKVTIELARLALIMQPAAIRWAAHEAATNMTETYGVSDGKA
tara:strand:- start:462 stop:674 length:213 start_codon:yes stop_codon:yes gene_type:complete